MDAEIRQALCKRLDAHFGSDEGTIIVEELGLCRGTVRVDVAVVNGLLRGYEIKSDRDTLVRLSSQAEVYNRVFDRMAIVVAERHLRSVYTLVPSWWGIQVPKAGEGCTSIDIECIRPEAENANVDPKAVVQLLWRDEAVQLLTNLEPEKSFDRETRSVLWDTLAGAVALPELRAMVSASLRNRAGWRVDEQRTSNGETFRPSARSSGSRSRQTRLRRIRYTDRPN